MKNGDFDMTQARIYLDYQATTPVDGRVAEVMVRVMQGAFGNPHSVEHQFGWEAEEIVEHSRQQVAGVLEAGASEIVFTSGATEANNLVLKGLMKALKTKGRTHVLVSNIEHACVLAGAEWLTEQGFEVEKIPVAQDGVISGKLLRQMLRSDTGLVSIMLVNNEIGTVQPIHELTQIAHEMGSLVHTDAAQGLGRLDLKGLGADLISLSAHKIYGPKGIGALYVKKEIQEMLEPQMLGGGQQGGLRSGTLAPMLCAGFGEAAWLADKEREADNARAKELLDGFEDKLKAAGIDYSVQGSRTQRIAQNLNLRFAGVPTDALQMAMTEVAFSSGAACTTEGDKVSHVLNALGMDAEAIGECFRIAVGRQTTEAEMDYMATQLIEVLKTLPR